MSGEWENMIQKIGVGKLGAGKLKWENWSEKIEVGKYGFLSNTDIILFNIEKIQGQLSNLLKNISIQVFSDAKTTTARRKKK